MRLCILAVILAVSLVGHAAERPPNIVYIVSDDQGYNDLGVLDKELIAPNLDRLVREGTRFTNFYVAWCACTPSRASLLTGRYPGRHGVVDMIRNEAPDYGHKYTPAQYAYTFERVGGMDEREQIIPKLLRPAGYVSAIYGKWDLGVHRRYLPTSRGFDEFYGFVNTGIDYFTHERYGVPSMYRNLSPTTEDQGTYCTDLFGREALKFITAHKDKPFFLYLPFNAPHGASSLDPKVRGAAQAHERHKKLYPHLKDDYTTRVSKRKGAGDEPAVAPGNSKVRLEYLASITGMDEVIGAVLNRLDELKLADRTLVVFHSDNGGSGGGGKTNHPLRGKKSTLFEGGVRVVCVMRFPGRIPAAAVNDQFITSMDLLPTYLKYAGLGKPEGLVLDGMDMTDVLAGRSSSPRDRMFWRQKDNVAGRVGQWKYIALEGGKTQMLFDLAADIGEQHDLSRSNPAKLAEMRAAVDEWNRRMEAAEPRGPFRDF
jgi:arylsulfatase A-like enzyme